MPMHNVVLVTGATGLLGREVVVRLLTAHPQRLILLLSRDPERAMALVRTLPCADRLRVIKGDLTADGLGLDADVRAHLHTTLQAIIHLGADTTFSRPLDVARSVNTAGTMRVLELAASCQRAVRFAHVSTAFVAGRRVGFIDEEAGSGTDGWVNAYEQSKFEAEALVRAHAAEWTILRSSTVVCDDLTGTVTQFNAAHRALRLYHEGLAAMMPGVVGSTVDTVTTDYVARAIATIGLHDAAVGRTFHLCAGQRAISLEALLDLTYARWAADATWRQRRIARPALADLPTYALFERTIEATADATLKRVTRALAHFVPQLALPKCFATSNADAFLGYQAPDPHAYWRAMVDRLLATNWGAAREATV